MRKEITEGIRWTHLTPLQGCHQDKASLTTHRHYGTETDIQKPEAGFQVWKAPLAKTANHCKIQTKTTFKIYTSFKLHTRLKMKQKDLYVRYHPQPSQTSLQNHCWPTTERRLTPCRHTGDITETALPRTAHQNFFQRSGLTKGTFQNSHCIFYQEVMTSLICLATKSRDNCETERAYMLLGIYLPSFLTVLHLLALSNS